MERKEFIRSLEKTFAKGIELVRIKNKDYGAESNPFKNFESAKLIGLDVKDAILVRTLDKLSRIGNLLHTEAAVKDETIEDTIVDAINYLAILKARIEFENSQHSHVGIDHATETGDQTVMIPVWDGFGTEFETERVIAELQDNRKQMGKGSGREYWESVAKIVAKYAK